MRCLHVVSPGWACLILLSGVLLSSATAQDPPQSESQLEPLSMSHELERIIPQIEFGGGPVADYVELVKQAGAIGGRSNLNVIVKPEAGRMSLPSIDLRNISLGSALEVISTATSGRVSTEQAGGSNGDAFIVIDRNYGAEVPSEMLVLNIRPILEEMSKEKMEAVFEVGMQMLESEELHLQLHEESGLLFAKGTTPALRMIQSAVEELTRSVLSRRGGPTQPAPTTAPGGEKR